MKCICELDEVKVTKKHGPKANLLDLLSHKPTLPGPKSSGFAPFWGLPRAAKELNSA
jgi:hypothetical protein